MDFWAIFSGVREFDNNSGTNFSLEGVIQIN